MIYSPYTYMLGSLTEAPTGDQFSLVPENNTGLP